VLASTMHAVASRVTTARHTTMVPRPSFALVFMYRFLNTFYLAPDSHEGPAGRVVVLAPNPKLTGAVAVPSINFPIAT